MTGIADPESGLPPDDRAGGTIIAGVVIVLVFFVGLGGWAAVAPLSSAVIASAVIKVEGNRKAVQHLEGGIVREIRVKEGATVGAGEVLIILDDTQARSAMDLYSRQHIELRAQEARLLAEQLNNPSVRFPEDLKETLDQSEITRILDAQNTLFTVRQVTMTGRINLINQRIAQTQEQITGADGQLAAQKRQLESIQQELMGLRDLFKKGYVPRQRMLELERSAASFEGQVAENAANSIKLRQSVGELKLQIAQLRADRMAEVANELRDVRLRLLEVGPRLQVARETFRRLNVVSPVSGVVVGLTAYTIGGVIAAGERIMEIVPDGGDLIVEATIDVADQKDLHREMPAEVHLTAYKKGSAPVVQGVVSYISADRITDSRTGANFYIAQIKISQQEVLRMKEIRMAPGMPALVVIPTGERTVLDYLLRPITDSMNRAFREQ